MPTGTNYTVAVVLINRHEPEGEAAGRLIEIAEEKGYDPRVVEASRGDHDVALSFRVPEDVAEAFNEDRAERWPSEVPADKIENDGELAADQADRDVAGISGDAYAADAARTAKAVQADNAAAADNNTPVDEPVAEHDNQNTSRSAKRGRASGRE
jgi:hypothetical protein